MTQLQFIYPNQFVSCCKCLVLLEWWNLPLEILLFNFCSVSSISFRFCVYTVCFWDGRDCQSIQNSFVNCSCDCLTSTSGICSPHTVDLNWIQFHFLCQKQQLFLEASVTICLDIQLLKNPNTLCWIRFLSRFVTCNGWPVHVQVFLYHLFFTVHMCCTFLGFSHTKTGMRRYSPVVYLLLFWLTFLFNCLQ